MKFHPVWIVWLLACTSLVLCQDGISINDATKSSILSDISNLQDYESTTSQKQTLTVREEQIEDELGNDATTTEKFMEKRTFIINPVDENEEYRETVTDRYNVTTVRSSLSSTRKTKVPISSSFKKYDDHGDVTDDDDSVDFTTSLDGLVKKSTVDNGERKTRQRLGVTTNRGKTRFQNEPGTSEVPEILTTLRHKKPIRVRPIDQNVNDEEVSTTSMADDLIDMTTIIDSSDNEQQRPKFKKPPLIATHHPNFGSSTEPSRRPAIRPNLNLKQKITSSTMKTRPSEPDVTEPENTISNNKTFEVVSSNTQLNKMRPIKVTSSKGPVAQQPIPPTATAWALASLKAPNNTNRIFRKPLNVSNTQEQIAKIKPFITWSTRLQKTNEENSNVTSASNMTVVTVSNDTSTMPTLFVANESSMVDHIKPEITSTESLRHIISTLSTNYKTNGNDSTVTVIGGDTDQNKYEVYGSQRPDIENTTTVIETLRPSSSTTSQNSNLLLVTSYKSIFENDNTSEVQPNIFPSSETPLTESILKKDDEITTTTTEQSNVFQTSRETLTTVNTETDKLPVIQTSTEIVGKTPDILFDYSEDQNNNKLPVSTAEVQSSSPDVPFLFSHDIDLNNENQSTTTEHYIESIKTKLDSKIAESTEIHDSFEIDNYSHMFLPERPISSTTDRTESVFTVSEKTTSELSIPSNEISNTSQQPNSYNISDYSESNSTESHDDVGDDGHKNIETSSQSSITVNEQISESDISENDVPIIITSSSTSTTTTTTPSPATTTTTSTTASPTTTSTTTTTTTPRPTTTTMTTTTTTTTTSAPTTTTTTTTTPAPTTSSITTTTTTSTTPAPTTTSTTPAPTTTSTTPAPTTTTNIPITSTTHKTTTPTTTTQKTTTPIATTTRMTTTSTSSPVIIEITTSLSTTTRPKPSFTLPATTTIHTTNSITSRPKPAVVDKSSTTPGADADIVQSNLKVIVNSTMEDVCNSEDELKAAIMKFFESGTESTNNQIQFLNVNENVCVNPNDVDRPVGVEFYFVNGHGEHNTYVMYEKFNDLLKNQRLDYKSNVIRVEFMKRMIEHENIDQYETDNPRVKTAIYLSCIAGVCSIIVMILLVVRKRQKRFNYGQRCTPVSLDDYSMDNISVYNSVRRKGALRASKRSYGNPAFDDSAAVSHSLNFAGLASFSEDRPAIDEEFSNVPVITVKPDELPPGAETKNRYANVIPMPETRVTLNARNSNCGGQNSDYINANFVKGYKGADKVYIACQAPMQSTLPDFWQMIWEQNTRVIMMVTSLTEKGVERCADYLPPSEVLDCHRLFGDYQVTLKKREVKEKFIISNLQLKNLETNLWRDVTHLWYGGWPVQGVPSDPGTLLSFLMEARSHMKNNNGPHVVHCSPGTGRTGTVIACDVAIREFELSRAVDIPKTVYAIRRCRAGAVQTRDQYALVYKVVNLYASKLSGGILDSI